jgi:hypothetical protein
LDINKNEIWVFVNVTDAVQLFLRGQ